jgi:NADH-quinone oxidoreductase subunit E
VSMSDETASVGRGTVGDEVDLEEVRQIVESRAGHRAGLIAALQDVQGRYGYLPERALAEVARLTGRSLVDVYGVATFYQSFSLEPRGQHVVSVCLGTACHVRGAAKVLEEFERQLGVGAGQTTADMEFTLETLNCLGACALGPAVVVDGRYFSRMRRPKVAWVIGRALEGFAATGAAGADPLRLEVHCPRCSESLMDPTFALQDHASVKLNATFDGRRGWVRLSAVYGRAEAAAEREVAESMVLRMFCPHCGAELHGPLTCPACDAPMVPLGVAREAVLQVCSRHGCHAHTLELN